MAYNKRRSKGKGRKDEREERRTTSPTGAPDSTEEAAKGPGANDVSWYTRYPNLVAAAGSFPYPNRPGMDVSFGTIDTSTTSTPNEKGLKVTVPGVLVMDWMPSIGISNKNTDPASVLGKEMYARVRAAYSGTLRADAPDYVMYVLALDSVFAYIAWLKRLYRVLNVWSPDNYVLPDGLLHGMGLTDLDIAKLRSERTKLWQLINQLILQSRKFTCPGSLDIINRHYWMSDNVYTDDATINSQFYMFNLRYVYEYDPQVRDADNPQNAVGGLWPQPMPWDRLANINGDGLNVLTADDLYTFGLNLINRIVDWDDSYTINGYLQRAYAGDPMFIVEELPLDAPFAPIFNPEVLMQIENSMCVPYGHTCAMSPFNFQIAQAPLRNAIVSNPTFQIAFPGATGASKSTKEELLKGSVKPYISVRSDMPNALENVIATRLKAHASSVNITTSEDGKTTYYEVTVDCASEVPFGWRMVGVKGNYDGTVPAGEAASADGFPQFVYLEAGPTSLAQNGDMVLNLWLKLCQFDWHPFILISWAGTALSPVPSGEVGFSLFGDIHNLTTVSSDELANLHRVCMFSEFNSFSMS